MPDDRRKWCKVCGLHADEVGPISWRGKCTACGQLLLERNVLSLHTHSGEQFGVWRRGMAACVGGVLLDDVQAKP